MKTVLAILLGLMLLTSLVGISYATPVQPSDNNNNCTPNQNNPNYDFGNCGAHSGGSDPHHGCSAPGQKAPDAFRCCSFGSHTDGLTCCVDGITPHSAEISYIQPDYPPCP
jgi:hypothetical protein